MIDCTQLREYIIRPALQLIDLYSKGAEELLIATCAQESRGGTYLKQFGGPALGIFQMEGATHDDLWDRCLVVHEKEGKTTNAQGYSILKACRYVSVPPAEAMIHNLYYASMMARIFWLDLPVNMPDPDNFDDIWGLYKKYWNTFKGAATKDQFIKNYIQFSGRHVLVDK